MPPTPSAETAAGQISGRDEGSDGVVGPAADVVVAGIGDALEGDPGTARARCPAPSSSWAFPTEGGQRMAGDL